MMNSADTIIIGAGPYGLSLAAHLRANGVAFELFGRTMGSWRHNMPSDMTLRSESFASNLWDPDRRYTLEAYCRTKDIPYQAKGDPVTLSRFLDYTDWFQQHAAPDVQDLEVTRLAQRDGGFVLNLSNGDVRVARQVIVAAGHAYFRRMPETLAAMPQPLVSHSNDHKDLSQFKAKKVIVVGAGQSALETAALLHEHGASVSVLARKSQILWNRVPSEHSSVIDTIRHPEAGLGPGWVSLAASEFPQVFYMLPRSTRYRVVARTWGPSGAWWLRDRVVGKVDVLTSHEVVSASERNGKAHLVVRTDSKTVEMEADHVVAATGFKADLGRLPFLEPGLLARIAAFNGAPKLNRGFESSVPGLSFVGMLSAPTFGPVMRFMFGAKHAAPTIAGRLARRVPSLASSPFGAETREGWRLSPRNGGAGFYTPPERRDAPGE